MRLVRLFLMTLLGTPAGLVGGWVPATVVLNMALPEAQTLSGLVLFATAGAIVAVLQRVGVPGGLPGWWPLASAVGWAALIALASGARDSENTSLRIAIPAGFLFSLLVGGALLLRRRPPPLPATAPLAPAAAPREPHPAGRFSGFRTGALGIPAYLLLVGAGHVALAMQLSSQATGPRDGQAFTGTLMLGLMFVVVSLFALPLTLGRERGAAALLRAAAAGLVVALAVVAYTASRGIDRGGEAGVIPCIVEQGREICAPGDGTYIRDARPDVPVMLLAALGAYTVAHILGRRGPSLSRARREN